MSRGGRRIDPAGGGGGGAGDRGGRCGAQRTAGTEDPACAPPVVDEDRAASVQPAPTRHGHDLAVTATDDGTTTGNGASHHDHDHDHDRPARVGAANLGGTAADPARDHDHGAAAYNDRDDDDHGGGDLDDALPGAALVGPSLDDATTGVSAPLTRETLMDLLAVVLVVLALVCEVVEAISEKVWRVHLGWLGRAFFFGAVLAAGGLHANIGS